MSKKKIEGDLTPSTGELVPVTTVPAPWFQNNYHRIRSIATDMEVQTNTVSETLPNQALSVKEIMRRFASGLPLSINNVKTYDDDGTGQPLQFEDYLPNLESLDPADRVTVLEQAKLQMEEIKTRLNAIASAKLNEQKQKDAEIKRLQQKVEKLEKTSPQPEYDRNLEKDK